MYWLDRYQSLHRGVQILEIEKKNLSAVLIINLGVPLTPQWSGNKPPNEKDYSTVEWSRVKKSSSGHHCMSGIYNIGHCVMTW